MCTDTDIDLTMTKEMSPLEITGVATGTVNIFPFLGGAVFQVAIGYIMDSTGKINGIYPLEAYALALRFCFFAIIISMLCSLLSKETYSD